MKICPKCRYLDHEENGPNYECPKCGVIYSRANKNHRHFEHIPKEELRPSWTWEEIKNGPKPRKWNFLLWIAMITAISIITAINIQKSLNGRNIHPSNPPIIERSNGKVIIRQEGP